MFNQDRINRKILREQKKRFFARLNSPKGEKRERYDPKISKKRYFEFKTQSNPTIHSSGKIKGGKPE